MSGKTERAKYCVLTCIDYRFQEKVFNWLHKKHMLGESDLIMVAGCSKDLVKPHNSESFESLLNQLSISVKLHNPENIILIDHQDCGGYAADGTIASGLPINEDRMLHEKYSKEAKDIITKYFPARKISCYYVSLENDIPEAIF